VQSRGLVAHSGASRVQNVNAVFFILGWALCEYHKNSAGTRYTKLVFMHPMRSGGHVVHSVASGCKTSTHYFSTFYGPGVGPHEACQDKLRRTCVFASCVIWRSRCGFWCVRGVKHRCTIFHVWVNSCWSHRKRVGTRYAELMFLHPVQSGGHIMRSRASGA
jgi:hypothetical protein